MKEKTQLKKDVRTAFVVGVVAVTLTIIIGILAGHYDKARVAILILAILDIIAIILFTVLFTRVRNRAPKLFIYTYQKLF